MKEEKLIANKFYVFQIWLTSIILAPLIMELFHVFGNRYYFTDPSDFTIFLLFIGIGLLYSLPTFFLCFFIFLFIKKKLSSALLIKIIVAIFSGIGAFITFKIVGKGTDSHFFDIFYLAGIVIASLLFSVYK